jgi:geranylgeranyl pyrophosphate synthase
VAAPASDMESIATSLSNWSQRFDEVLEAGLPRATDGQKDLIESMRYSALGPGKRIRPYLTIRCCEITGGAAFEAYPAAVAIECVHAFSLIHDDLPAMDNDAMRRGRPANHVVFGEAMAVLSGDALLAYAFGTLADRIPDPRKVVASVRELSRATGVDGMIGGQACDILSETLVPSEPLVEYIHLRKTARLMEASCRLGAIASGAPAEWITRMGRFGRDLGLAFQMTDDLLDVCGEARDMGKAVAKDAAAGKQTAVALLGVEGAREAADRQAQSAVEALSAWGPSADDLRQLTWFVAARAS